MRLTNKVAVVTGGNSGIGLSIAKEFIAQGANVVIFGRNPETLTLAASELGSSAHAVQGDVSSTSHLERLVAETQNKFGKIDVLVANAGIATPAPIEQTTEETFDLISNINFRGLFFTIQKAIPALNDNASIVLTTSGVNQMGMPGLSVYSATKAAVRSFARTFSAELLPRGIRVNALSPGPIETPIFDRLGLPQDQLDQMADQILKQTPIGRFGRPEEMAKAALFLASDDSSYVVGAELVADGGISQL